MVWDQTPTHSGSNSVNRLISGQLTDSTGVKRVVSNGNSRPTILTLQHIVHTVIRDGISFEHD